MMARMTPVSLHFSDAPTGWKKIFTDKQQLATGFACSSRTVSPDEQCYRLICASCTQFHVPLGTQAFQLPQAASSKGRYHDAADVACLPLLLLKAEHHLASSRNASATEFPRHRTTRMTRSRAPFAQTFPSANETATTKRPQTSRVRDFNQTFCIQKFRDMHICSLDFKTMP